ncbi:MAG: hypothetical protein AB1489_24165 [Acidobacteriota bacterium]
MLPDRFNETCRYLARDSMVSVQLVTGNTVIGFPLHHTPAGEHNGTLELETDRGILRLFSSQIASIEPISDLTA